MTPALALAILGGLLVGGIVGYVIGRVHGFEALLSRVIEVIPELRGHRPPRPLPSRHVGEYPCVPPPDRDPVISQPQPQPERRDWTPPRNP